MTTDKTTQAPQPEAQPQWQPIETAQEDGRKLILSYINRNDMPRTVMARWLTDDEAAETDADGVGLEGGWYECIDNWDDYTEVAIHEGEPTHWMPLPAAPSAQAEPIAAHEDQQAPPYTAPKLRALIDRVAERQAGEAVAWVDAHELAHIGEPVEGGPLEPSISKEPVSEHDIPLFTHPQQPLSDEQIKALRPLPFSNAELDRLYANIPPTAQQDARSREAFKRIARWIESAHGIGITKDTK